MRCPGRTFLTATAVALCAPAARAQTITPDEGQVRGWVSPNWSPATNACLPDVAGALGRLPELGMPVAFQRSEHAPAMSRLGRHWQGIQRLPVGDGRYLAVSRSGAPSAFSIVHIAPPDRAGDAPVVDHLAWGSWSAPPPGQVVTTVASPEGHRHPGGLQSVGAYLAVPFHRDGGRAEVHFYDLSDPGAPRHVSGFLRAQVGGSRDLDEASAVAVTRLDDGRYLILVGVHSSKILDVYLTEGPSLEGDVVFRYVQSVAGAVNGSHQSLNLVTQCDGTLFLVGFHNTMRGFPALGSDHLHAYRLDGRPSDASVRFTEVLEHRFRCEACDFAAAGGLYVGPSGEVAVYGIEHTDDGPDGTVRVEEFALPDRVRTARP